MISMIGITDHREVRALILLSRYYD